MKTMELKITRIGNSRGVRIPAGVLRRYAFTDAAIMSESVDGVLLRPKQQANDKLSWDATAAAMAKASEDWSDWESVSADGLTDLPWEKVSVADKPSDYGPPCRKMTRKKS